MRCVLQRLLRRAPIVLVVLQTRVLYRGSIMKSRRTPQDFSSFVIVISLLMGIFMTYASSQGDMPYQALVIPLTLFVGAIIVKTIFSKTPTPTFGDFYAEVAKTTIPIGRACLATYRDSMDRVSWEELINTRLDRRNCTRFSSSLTDILRRELGVLYDDKTQLVTLERAHAFLDEVRSIAERFTIDLSMIVDTPLTVQESLAQSLAEELKESQPMNHT